MNDEVDATLGAIGPLELLQRMMTLLERLTDRVEVLELEQLHARTTDAALPQTEPRP
jgi:hypothetical protein